MLSPASVHDTDGVTKQQTLTSRRKHPTTLP